MPFSNLSSKSSMILIWGNPTADIVGRILYFTSVGEFYISCYLVGVVAKEKGLESVRFGIKICLQFVTDCRSVKVSLMFQNLCFLTDRVGIIILITLSDTFVKIKWEGICKASGTQQTNVNLPLSKFHFFVNCLLEKLTTMVKILVMKLSFKFR